MGLARLEFMNQVSLLKDLNFAKRTSQKDYLKIGWRGSRCSKIWSLRDCSTWQSPCEAYRSLSAHPQTVVLATVIQFCCISLCLFLCQLSPNHNLLCNWQTKIKPICFMKPAQKQIKIMSNTSNPVQHLRRVKELQGIIASYEHKLDDKVNEVFEHIINHSNNINDNEHSLPRIDNKKIAQTRPSPGQINHTATNRKVRAQSTGAYSLANASTVINGFANLNSSQDFNPADELLRSYKARGTSSFMMTHEKNQEDEVVGTRAIGSQKYGKPKILRKKPQILSKQMRWDPFYEKNAIKAQELNQGMMRLIERGKVSKNIDIITAFEKGSPVLNANPAIFHHVEEKYAESDIQQQISRITKKRKQDNANSNIEKQNKFPKKIPQSLIDIEDAQKRQNMEEEENCVWALTVPENSKAEFLTHRRTNFDEGQILQNFSLEFLHYKVVKDQNFRSMKQTPNFNENWGEVLQILKQIEKTLKEYTVQLCFINSSKIMELIRTHFSLRKLRLKQISDCITRKTVSEKPFSLKTVKNPGQKKQMSIQILQPFFKMASIREKYVEILRRKKIQKRMAGWLRNGSIIKQYREGLADRKEEVYQKFDVLQKRFRLEYPSIQATKHYQIHVANFNFMKGFRYFQEFCTIQITRIFNLQNSNTNIIYLCPFELNVDTINYYFKIMELQEIQLYNDRVTFLQLQDLGAHPLPHSLNTSAKLYYNSKALRKLKRKTLGTPAYFVTSYPSQTDINLAVHLNIPILSGNFHSIAPLRSALNSDKFETESLPALESLRINPKETNVFQISNLLVRHCQSNKKHRKYVIKINGKCSSSGLALLQYPFSSLPQLYASTSLVQPYYYPSIQKFYSDLARFGGVVEFYIQGLRTITVCGRVLHDESHIVTGTFERISNGFVNIGYLFPQKCLSHRTLVEKTRPLLQKLIQQGHIGFVEITIAIDLEDRIFLQQVELFSTKITNSLSYFKFLQGGYFNTMGEFMTKVAGQDDPEGMIDDSIASMEPRGYCYIPFMLHFGLSEKQTASFFQLCRIAGISFDLQNKFGTTFVLLGQLKNTIGILTTAKQRKSIIKLVSKAAEFLIKQNSHNISPEMLREKEGRLKERYNITAIKERFQELIA